MEISVNVLLRRWTLAVLSLAFPTAALADLNGSVVLQTNTALNLDTGATASSGGDILWTGTSIAPQAGAKAYSAGAGGGLANCTGLTQSYYQNFVAAASSAAIPNTKLTAGSSFIVVTTTGNLAKVCIIANSSGLIAFQFTTYGASATPGVPAITQIVNNSSAAPFGQPNYGIAPSSIFVVQGTSLADPGAPALQSSAPPGIPLTLNGASITVVVNGVTTQPALYYTSPTQLAAVLPAATPVGNGTLTVTYRGQTSAPALIQVVPAALGINSYSVNSGVATDAVSGALITTTTSASPGQTIILWTTGLGADPGDSDTTFASAPHSVNTPLQIYIGGVLAGILYQGSAGYPGVDQINLTIPSTAPTGCWVAVVAVTGSVISNVVTLPINNGGGACVDVVTGLNGNQVSPTGNQTLKTGVVTLVHTVSPGNAGTTSSANAAFEKYTGLYNPGKSLSPGGCTVGPIVGAPVPSVTGLDAGTITLTGPNGLALTMGATLGIKGLFTANLGANGIASTGGAFTVNGSGGADVGPFTVTITLANPLLTMTSQSGATIDRTQGMPVTWTGGNPGTYVYITGVSTSLPGLGIQAGFTCLVSVDAKQFTVPPAILLGLPPGSGGVGMQNTFFSSLSASGLDVGEAVGSVSYSNGATTFK
jgi:uncharacterized protein (TIGR03437 family)